MVNFAILKLIEDQDKTQSMMVMLKPYLQVTKAPYSMESNDSFEIINHYPCIFFVRVIERLIKSSWAQSPICCHFELLNRLVLLPCVQRTIFLSSWAELLKWLI